MRRVTVAATFLITITAASAFAQGIGQPQRAYVSAGGGIVATGDGTSGHAIGEAGFRISPNLFLFGDVGRFQNLASSTFQSAADSVAADFAAAGLNVTATSTVPTWYSLGGVRYVFSSRTARVSPYVFGGAGFAHLMPQNKFVYSSGTLLGASPNPGDDVTSQLVSLGEFSQPATSNAFMFSTGGGVEIPIARSLGVDVGYRLSRIAADTPVTAHTVTAGLGYRF